MHPWQRLWLLSAALGWLAFGCTGDGGRGSSGFDIKENLIIVRVLETQECVTTQQLTFCPADQAAGTTPTPTATAPTPTGQIPPTATPGVQPPPQVNTGLAGGAAISCTQHRPGDPCRLTFAFSAVGFGDQAGFRVVARLREPNSDWSLAESPVPVAGTDPAMFEVPVSLDVPVAAHAPRVQLAVLAFRMAPESVPRQFELLADTVADFAFVTPEVALEVIVIDPLPTPPFMETATLVPESPTPASATGTMSTRTTPTPIETPPTPIDTLPSPIETPPAPTATATARVPLIGPVVTYFGVARADSSSLAPSEFDPEGRPIYVRPLGFGLALVVEGRPGDGNRRIGSSAYAASGVMPDLQLIVSRPLGDGSTVVCDDLLPSPGGVPATVPLVFSEASSITDAVNDLGCRVDDGTGEPLARTTSLQACTQDRSGIFAFVDAASSTQFCLPIAPPWGFPSGDTIVAARLRDIDGNVGPPREIVVRNVSSSVASPTPLTPIPSRRPASPTRTSTTTAKASAPPSPNSPVPTPTATPYDSGDTGPLITHLGLAHADDRPATPISHDPAGRPIYRSRTGQGISLIVEARPGRSLRDVGMQAYQPGTSPDLQVIVSRPLGNGSETVCDKQPPMIGGVPATNPLIFSDDPHEIDAINDLGCRVDDGTGAAQARRDSRFACTSADHSETEFAFVNTESTAQYCLRIASQWKFPPGDTIVAARVRDTDGNIGPGREIVVRAGK